MLLLRQHHFRTIRNGVKINVSHSSENSIPKSQKQQRKSGKRHHNIDSPVWTWRDVSYSFTYRSIAPRTHTHTHSVVLSIRGTFECGKVAQRTRYRGTVKPETSNQYDQFTACFTIPMFPDLYRRQLIVVASFTEQKKKTNG